MFRSIIRKIKRSQPAMLIILCGGLSILLDDLSYSELACRLLT